MLKRSVKDTLAPALSFLIGIIRSSKKNVGRGSALLRNEPLKRISCSVSHTDSSQTQPAQHELPVWLCVKRREAQRGGRAPVLVLYLLADSQVAVHHQLAFIRWFIYHQILLRIHVNPSRGFFFVCFFLKFFFYLLLAGSSLLHSIFFL